MPSGQHTDATPSELSGIQNPRFSDFYCTLMHYTIGHVVSKSSRCIWPPHYLISTSAPDSSHAACKVAQSCPTLCSPVNCSQPGSSVHGVLQARFLELAAIPFSRGKLPNPGTEARSPALQADFSRSEPPGPGLLAVQSNGLNSSPEGSQKQG